MPKTDDNIKANEDFIRNVLEKNFGQIVEAEPLRVAATKLCAALPHNKPKAD